MDSDVRQDLKERVKKILNDAVPSEHAPPRDHRPTIVYSNDVTTVIVQVGSRWRTPCDFLQHVLSAVKKIMLRKAAAMACVSILLY